MLIIFGVDEPDRGAVPEEKKPGLRRTDIKRLPPGYVYVVTIAGVLTLARFSEAFLVLRAQSVGFTNALAPLVMVVMSAVYAVTSYPAGAAADRGHGASLLSWGLLTLIVSDFILAYGGGRATFWRAPLCGGCIWD